MKRIYIAGPMTGLPKFNFPAFFAAEEFLHRKNGPGLHVFNPARRDLEKYGSVVVNETGDPDEAKAAGFSLREALAMDTDFICRFATDIYMLKGWENSRGARAEHALAQALDIEVEYEADTGWLAWRDTPQWADGYAYGYQDGHTDATEGVDYR